MLPESFSDKRQEERGKAEPACPLSKSPLTFEVSQPHALWEMAQSGQLKNYTSPAAVIDALGGNGVVLNVVDNALTLSLKLSSKVWDAFEKVNFDHSEFQEALTSSLHGKVQVNSSERTISLLEEGATPHSVHASAQWPCPNGAIYDWAFRYMVPMDMIADVEQFQQELRRGLAALTIFLSFGFREAGRAIPTTTIKLQGPKGNLEEAGTEDETRLSAEDVIVFATPYASWFKPRFRLDALSGCGAGAAVAELQAAAKEFLKNNAKPALGLQNHLAIVLHGDVSAADQLAEGLAGDLNAGLCRVNPSIFVIDQAPIIRELLTETHKHAGDFVGKKIVFELYDSAVAPEDLPPGGAPMAGITWETLCGAFQGGQDWNNFVFVVNVRDCSRVNPDFLRHCAAVLSTEFDALGAAAYLEDLMKQTAARSQGVISFDLNAIDAAQALWDSSCQTRTDFLDVFELAVRTKGAQAQAIRSKPITRGHLLLAWERLAAAPRG